MLFPHEDAQPEIFQGRGSFVELGHFDKHFVKNTRKKGSAGKSFGLFSPRYCQNHISNEKFNPKMDTINTFFPKLGHFFRFSIKDKGGIMCFSLSLAILCLQKRQCCSTFLY